MTRPAVRTEIDAETAIAQLSRDRLDATQPACVNAVDVVVEGLRTLGQDRRPAAVMRLATAAAVASMPGAVDAAVIVRTGDRLRTLAQTSDLPLVLETLQYAHGGPGVDAAVGARQVVHVEDLRADPRWPAFVAAALTQSPVLGILSYPLFVGNHDEAIGSLNLYAIKPHAFDLEAVTAGQRLAAYTAVTLAYAAEREKVHNLERALDSSRDIGAATGILMTRHLVTREHAFNLLSTASQHSNRKLREVAVDVIDTGDIPVRRSIPHTPRPKTQD